MRLADVQLGASLSRARMLARVGLWLTAPFLLGISPIWSKAAEAERVQTETKKGAFSLAPTFGFANKTLLNPSGRSIGFSGTEYGVDMSVSLMQSLSFFAETRIVDAKNQDYDTERLQGRGYSLGVRFPLSDWFELGMGYGEEVDTVKNSTVADRTVTSRALSASFAVHFLDLGDSLGFFLVANYRLGLANASQREETVSNSGGTTVDAYIGLRWSPTVSFTYRKSSK